MQDTENMHHLPLHSVNDDVRERRKDQLSCSCLLADSPPVGHLLQRTSRFVEIADCRLGERGVMLTEIVADTLKVGRGSRSPSNAFQD